MMHTIHEVTMRRRFTTSTLIVLWCAACATVETVPTDPRVVEAQRAFDEGKRLSDLQVASAKPRLSADADEPGVL
jgi:hypothetical protein